jgi:alkylation response protein AidB-like acyl-CoA dehydrogenase
VTRSGGPDRATVDCPLVDFELSSDQVALRDAADSVLDDHASADRVRAFVGLAEPVPAEGDFDRQLWQVMVDQGWTAVEQAEDGGGLGLGMVEVGLLCEQLGRRVAPVPYLGTVVAADAFRAAAADPGQSPEVREASAEWAGRLAAGQAVAALAFTPDGGGATELSADGSCRLSAPTEPTVFASVADVAVVVTGDAMYQVALDPERRPPPEPAMDRTRSMAWLRLDGTPARRIGGPEAAGRTLDRAAAAVSAELLGASSRALEMSVGYAKDRVQFGKPIGSFQAVKHRLADALVDVEGMRSSVYYASWCLASGHPDATLAASSAKVWCSDASHRVMASCLQVHGGIGFTWEHDLHLLVKRAQLDASSWGDAAFHRERIATLLSRRTDEDPSLF